MIQKNKTEWLIFPDGERCWWVQGYPAINGRCIWCGRTVEEHKKGKIEIK